jgi:hypothetical protein
MSQRDLTCRLLARAGLIAVVMLAGLLTTGCAGTRPGERILSLDAAIRVHDDDSLTVRETIRVRSAGMAIRHGIVEALPLMRLDSRQRPHAVDYHLEEVLRNGLPLKYRVRRTNDALVIYLGEHGVPLPPGEHSYLLAYRTSPLVHEVGRRRELVWTARSPGGALPVDAASVVVDLPDSVPRDALRVFGYSGPPGRELRDVRARVAAAGQVVFTTRGALGTDDGLRVVVSWPADSLDTSAVPTQNGAQRF